MKTGISEIVGTLNTKFPRTRILVSGILPRWKRSAQEGMNYKRKKNDLNSDLNDLQSCTFCPQDNFQKHMFYDGTHLNNEGTAQLVSNYKYLIWKVNNKNTNATYAQIVKNTSGNRNLQYNNRPGSSRYDSSRDFYGQGRSVRRNKTSSNRNDDTDKFQSFVNLLKDFVSSNS